MLILHCQMGSGFPLKEILRGESNDFRHLQARMEKSSRKVALFSFLVRDNLKAQYYAIARVYTWLDDVESRVGTVRCQHFPCNGVCYEICNLQSYKVLLF